MRCLAVWHDTFGKEPVEARTVIEHPTTARALPEEIGDHFEPLDVRARRLGRALSARKDRRFPVVEADGKRYALVIRRKAGSKNTKRAIRWAVLRKRWG